jgi:hypothetical protein
VPRYRNTRLPAMQVCPAANTPAKAFLWSKFRTVTTNATICLHNNRDQVDELLVGARSSWCSTRST